MLLEFFVLEIGRIVRQRLCEFVLDLDVWANGKLVLNAARCLWARSRRKFWTGFFENVSELTIATNIESCVFVMTIGFGCSGTKRCVKNVDVKYCDCNCVVCENVGRWFLDVRGWRC